MSGDRSNADHLEQEIAEMSTWTGTETRLWESALESERAASRWSIRRFTRRVPPRAIAAVILAAVSLGVLVVAAQSPELDEDSIRELAREYKRHEAEMAAIERQLGRVPQEYPSNAFDASAGRSFGGGSSPFQSTDLLAGARIDRDQTEGFGFVEPDRSMSDEAESPGRQIAMSATVSIRSTDVRAIVEQARALVDATAGEFIEDASIAGEGGDAVGQLVLRIRAERLESVLAAVRGLGLVVSEQVSAEDLTDQLVDTEARLRNERRVEAELLELMADHERLDLDGLVRLRSELGSVRGRIERMDASRLSMERRVALSSVWVEVRGRDALPEIETGWERFWRGAGDSWDRGVLGLGRSLGGLVSWIVGRVLWWVPAAVIGMFAWRLWKRSARG